MKFLAFFVIPLASVAMAADPGFTEDFVGAGNLGGFFSGAQLSNSGSGGVGGANDGFVQITRNPAGQFAIATDAPQFNGNLIADGVTGFSFWLNDLGQHENYEMHLALGTAGSSFWVNSIPLIPPDNTWGYFSVSILNPSEWVRVQGSGTFQQALENCNRVQLRHDMAPFHNGALSIAGDLGFDRITVVPEPPTYALLLPTLLFLRRRAR